jgi:hypothetical protein
LTHFLIQIVAQQAGPVQAREAFAAKRKDFVIGVKEAASNGRTGRGGRWLA